MPVRAALVGASGYTGAELIRLIWGHPKVELVGAFARKSAGRRLDAVLPSLAGMTDIEVGAFDADVIAAGCDVAFTALPHGASATCVGELVDRGVRVIDLSADFRLDQATYEQWYGEHPRPDLLETAVLGLPELFEGIEGSMLIACPGCYVTTALLALAPLLRSEMIAPAPIIIDAKSGASGAGRGPGLGTHLPEVGEGIRAYKVAGTHRHTPEIEVLLSAAANCSVSVTFTPHLVPMSRGILACAYARPGARFDAASLEGVVVDAWSGSNFVSALRDRLPDTAHVRGSNRAHVAVRYDARTETVLAFAALDNLVKGAAGQALQCLNLALGWDERLGLDLAPLFP